MTNQLLAKNEALPGIGHNMPPLAEMLDEELAPRRARAEQLIEIAGSSVIVDEESASKVIDLVRMLKELHDDTDAERLRKTKPYRDAQKMVNDHYHALQLKLTLAIGGTSGRDGLSRMLTAWDDKQRAAVDAERRRLADEARQREAEAAAARAAADAKAKAGRTDPAAELEAVRAHDQAELLARRAEAIRHEPTRSQLGQTTRRRQIRFVVEDFSKRLRGILRSPRRSQVEKLVDDITEHELRDLGVAAVEKGVVMDGVKSWVEDSGVSVRR